MDRIRAVQRGSAQRDRPKHWAGGRSRLSSRPRAGAHRVTPSPTPREGKVVVRLRWSDRERGAGDRSGYACLCVCVVVMGWMMWKGVARFKACGSGVCVCVRVCVCACACTCAYVQPVCFCALCCCCACAARIDPAGFPLLGRVCVVLLGALRCARMFTSAHVHCAAPHRLCCCPPTAPSQGRSTRCKNGLHMPSGVLSANDGG